MKPSNAAVALTALSLSPVALSLPALASNLSDHPHADYVRVDVTAGLSVAHATAFLPPSR